MSWQARFRVEDVWADGQGPVNVLAVATAARGDVLQSIEPVLSMELRVLLNSDRTTLKVGDLITIEGIR